MTPAQVNQGDQNVTGHIIGSNFAGIVAVDLDIGIRIQQTRIISSTDLEVVFSVNTDAPAGKRTIRVSNLEGVATNSDVLSVSNNRAPVASFAMNPSQGAKNTLFSFNASNSSDSDGNIVSYNWNFGDGHTASGSETTHKYTEAGNFKVKLTVTDDHQGQGTAEREVLIENLVYPIARFSYTPHAGPITTHFQFDGSASVDQDGRIVRYIWDFQEGAKVQGKVVRHTFNKVDVFAVTLTVTDNSGLESAVAKDVTVRGKNPVASFSINPSIGDVNTNFQFDATSSSDQDGRVSNYAWDFGDGNTGSGKVVSHKYSSNGDYTTQLVVTDDSDLEDSTRRSVSVSTGGGGGQGACTSPAQNRGFIYGTVIGVRGQWAIVQLPAGSTCGNSFYKCGDMRRANPEQFRGIIKAMKDVGNNIFEIYNDCPFIWPPAIGERVFLYWKSCATNYCP